MPNRAQMRKLFSNIQIVRAPQRRLSTFGVSNIPYYLVTNVPGFDDRSRLRMGNVRADKPAILTKETLQNQFQGFGDDSQKFADWLTTLYGQALRGLEYQFRNEPGSSRIELTSPDKLTKKISADIDTQGLHQNALLRGTDKYWELSVMKFIVEETLASFKSNFQELDERGFFDGPDRHVQRHHREIQTLIRRAQNDPDAIPLLGKKLKEYQLFDHYQDDFFRLVQS